MNQVSVFSVCSIFRLLWMVTRESVTVLLTWTMEGRELNNCDDVVLLVLFCRRAVRIERGSGENMVVLLNFTARYDVRSSRHSYSTHMIMTHCGQNKIRK